MASSDPFRQAVSEATAKFAKPAASAIDFEIDSPTASSEIFRQMTLAADSMARDLLAWRAVLTSATNSQPESMAFIVPELALPGASEAFGSQVIHSAEVRQAMVAVGVPRIG